jgi:endo-1,4-beta-xylanase
MTISGEDAGGARPSGLGRCQLLAMGPAALVGLPAAVISAWSAMAESATLREFAERKGLQFGTAVLAEQIGGDPSFAGLVIRQAGLVATENDMKWEFINRGTPGDDDFGPADAIAQFAAANGLALRGHNVLWYRRTPRWFLDLATPAEKERAIIQRIETLVSRYRAKVHSWDVVNEPIEPRDGRPDNLRVAVFLEALGTDYLDLAHHLTRETDPAARLVVNEYNVELDTPEPRPAGMRWSSLSRGCGTPLDAVGIQGHLAAVGGPPFSATRLRRFLADVAALGVTIQITELDVTDENAPADETVRDRLVAETYRRFLDAALDETAVKVVVTWGLPDRYSWIVRRQTNPTKWRSDGLPSRPLPFAADFAAKSAFEAIAQSFRNAPHAHLADAGALTQFHCGS